MTNLQLHSKREPQLALPSSVAEANSGVLYTGMLKGYYVPNTNYYNVLPIDVEIAKDKSTILGEILENNPLAELHDEELKCIKFLDVEIDQTKTAIERFREIRSRKISDENVTYVKNFLRNKITIDVDSSIPFLIGWWKGKNYIFYK